MFDKDEIIEMAVQAGLYSGNPRTPSTGRMIEKRLEAFAKLVAAKERELCAKLCVERGLNYQNGAREFYCAEAIRARGEA